MAKKNNCNKNEFPNSHFADFPMQFILFLQIHLLLIFLPNAHFTLDYEQLNGVLFGDKNKSPDQFHFHYDKKGIFTINGGKIEDLELPMSASLLFRPMKCTENVVDLRFEFCANTSKCKSNEILSLVLCYKSQLAPTRMWDQFAVNPVNAELTEICAKRAKAEKGRIAMEMQRFSFDENTAAAKEFFFGDFNDEDGEEEAKWNGIEVQLNVDKNEFKLNTSMTIQEFTFSAGQTKCFVMQIAQNISENFPHVKIMDQNNVEKVNVKIKNEAEMLNNIFNVGLVNGQKLEEMINKTDRLGLWLLALDFLPKTKRVDEAFQVLLKLPSKDTCGSIMAKISGESVHPCKFFKKEFKPTGEPLEQRGQWTMYKYNISYGQIQGNETLLWEQFCALCNNIEYDNKREIFDEQFECRECKKLHEILAKINKAIYQTQGYVSHFYMTEFLPGFLLMPQKKQKEPGDFLGRMLPGNIKLYGILDQRKFLDHFAWVSPVWAVKSTTQSINFLQNAEAPNLRCQSIINFCNSKGMKEFMIFHFCNM